MINSDFADSEKLTLVFPSTIQSVEEDYFYNIDWITFYGCKVTFIAPPDTFIYNYLENMGFSVNAANPNKAVLSAVGEEFCTITIPADSLAADFNVTYEVIFNEKTTIYEDSGNGVSFNLENLEKDTEYSVIVNKITDFGIERFTHSVTLNFRTTGGKNAWYLQSAPLKDKISEITSETISTTTSEITSEIIVTNLGDINLNSQIGELSDVILLGKYLGNKAILTEQQEINANCNSDVGLTSNDLIALVKLSFGEIDVADLPL